MTVNSKIMQIPKVTERSALAKSIGSRMRQAREIAGMSQSVAAQRLGYSNSSKLAKVEGGTDTNSVPLWLIIRAARLYEVSIDYLFGESDDWELSARKCQERDVSKWVFQAWEVARQRDMDVLKRLNNRLESMDGSVNSMLATSEELTAAMRRFMELNPEFEENMRGGSRLLVSVERMSEVANGAKARMERFRRECSVGAIETPQLELL